MIAAAMIAPAAFFIPLSDLFSPDEPPYVLLIKTAVLVVGIILYLFLHEWTHGILMKLYGGVKPKYGFTGLYAYAGSTAFFDKKEYGIIALSPIVLLGVLLLLLNFFVPYGWFWVVYLLQIINVSGAAGDLYVFTILRKFPKDLLVRDSGVAMELFAKGDQDCSGMDAAGQGSEAGE